MALIRCTDEEGKANGEAVVQVLSAGNPYFPRVKFLACSVAEYDWYVSTPGAVNQVPLNARFHLCKGRKDDCETGAGSLRDQLVEHVDKWAALKLSTAKWIAHQGQRTLREPDLAVVKPDEGDKEEEEFEDEEECEEEQEEEPAAAPAKKRKKLSGNEKARRKKAKQKAAAEAQAKAKEDEEEEEEEEDEAPPRTQTTLA